MGAIVKLEIRNPDLIFVEAARTRLQAFWPDMSVARNGAVVSLTSENRTAVEMETVWRCALVNEALVANNEFFRARLLDELLA